MGNQHIGLNFNSEVLSRIKEKQKQLIKKQALSKKKSNPNHSISEAKSDHKYGTAQKSKFRACCEVCKLSIIGKQRSEWS